MLRKLERIEKALDRLSALNIEISLLPYGQAKFVFAQTILGVWETNPVYDSFVDGRVKAMGFKII